MAGSTLASPSAEPVAAATVRPPVSPARETWRRFRRHKLAMASTFVLTMLVLGVVIGPWVWPVAINEIDFSAQLQGPSLAHPFGTDDPEEVAERCAAMVEWAIDYQSSGDVAAFIAEPGMGEGGILVPPASYFGRVKEILDRNEILFIADEVQPGFGRTGKMFAIEHYDI